MFNRCFFNRLPFNRSCSLIIDISGTIEGILLITSAGDVYIWYCEPPEIEESELSQVETPESRLPLQRVPLSRMGIKMVPISQLDPVRLAASRMDIKKVPESQTLRCRKVKEG